jgi:serine/threonine protein kinase
MALVDWEGISGGKRAGGQGYVQKVRHRGDGRIGALKRLHGDASTQTERRYRLLTEVGGLRAMAGNGVPHVFESNEDQWEKKDVELYLVMEFVEGSTMAELVQTALPSLDDAIVALGRIVEVLAAGHKLPLHHRDLKPDNVIFRDARWSDPVLVDLGIAWHGAKTVGDFETPQGQELGNRFLRLPEFAPGGDHRDARSDIAMAAGLLFFMLSGRAPRVPFDHLGRYPHEVQPSPIRDAVLKDPRWSRIQSLLRVAFQPRLELRFQNAEEFCRRLALLNADPVEQPDSLDQEISRLRELTESAVGRERAEAAPAMERASRDLCAELGRIWRQAGLQWAGQNPIFKDGGSANEFYCVVSRQGQQDPAVVFRHKIELSEGRLATTWKIDGASGGRGYEGSAADSDGLRDAMLSLARNLASQVIRELNDKLTPKADLKPFFET